MQVRIYSNEKDSTNNEIVQLRKRIQEQAHEIEKLQEALGDVENMRQLTKKLILDADYDHSKIETVNWDYNRFLASA